MAKVEQIIATIETLSDEEFAKLRNWIIQRDWQRWDRQIEEDSENGKLDFLVKEAMAEKHRGKLRKL